MKFILLTSTALLGAIGLMTHAWAEPNPIEGSSTVLSATETTENFEYDAERLGRLATEINRSITTSDEIRNERMIEVIHPPQELGLPDDLVITNSDGDFGVGTELQLDN